MVYFMLRFDHFYNLTLGFHFPESNCLQEMPCFQ